MGAEKEGESESERASERARGGGREGEIQEIIEAQAIFV